MAGPVLSIELLGPVPDQALALLGGMLAGISSRFRQERRGAFDLNVDAASLGVVDTDARADRPILVRVNGPGFGDEDTFEAEHADGPDWCDLIGFIPTHEVAVLAMTNGRPEHLMLAELTARIQELVGGLVNAELHREQIETVQVLPGVVSVAPQPWGASAFGTAVFLRAWAAAPGFRLVK
ncbi:DUF6368 family protein [Actinoplanes sp. NPDC048796]|uniref:DUF6368 family protein n=1 Tax=unclassified Actinoplanes TaxID=2626549 RepID=UPI0033D4BB1B